jgi:hypothetical protein
MLSASQGDSAPWTVRQCTALKLSHNLEVKSEWDRVMHRK